MLTNAETALLCAKINAHHGNAALDPLVVQTMQEEIRPDATLRECCEAVRRWYAANTTGRWMRAGDINAEIRKMRNDNKPSEAQIEAETRRLGLTEYQAWDYRRQRMLGRQPDDARLIAVNSHPLFIEPPQPKPQQHVKHDMEQAGDLDIDSIIGK